MENKSHVWNHQPDKQTEGVLMGGAGVQIVETNIFWELLWWKHLHMKNMQKNNGKKSDPCPQPGLSPDLAQKVQTLSPDLDIIGS